MYWALSTNNSQSTLNSLKDHFVICIEYWVHTTHTRFSLSFVLSSTSAIRSGDSLSVRSLLGWLERPLSNRLEWPLLPLRVRSLRSVGIMLDGRFVFVLSVSWTISVFIFFFLSNDTFESSIEISGEIREDRKSKPFFKLERKILNWRIKADFRNLLSFFKKLWRYSPIQKVC